MIDIYVTLRFPPQAKPVVIGGVWYSPNDGSGYMVELSGAQYRYDGDGILAWYSKAQWEIIRELGILDAIIEIERGCKK